MAEADVPAGFETCCNFKWVDAEENIHHRCAKAVDHDGKHGCVCGEKIGG